MTSASEHPLTQATRFPWRSAARGPVRRIRPPGGTTSGSIIGNTGTWMDTRHIFVLIGRPYWCFVWNLELLLFSTQTWFNPTGMISNARPIQILPRERNHQIIVQIAKLTLDPSGSMVEICVIKYVTKYMYNVWQWEKNNEQLAREIPNTITIYIHYYYSIVSMITDN